ncbi:MAG: hypothetical protein AAB443_02460 [Patescibacteria group bacterium]
MRKKIVIIGVITLLILAIPVLYFILGWRTKEQVDLQPTKEVQEIQITQTKIENYVLYGSFPWQKDTMKLIQDWATKEAYDILIIDQGEYFTGEEGEQFQVWVYCLGGSLTTLSCELSYRTFDQLFRKEFPCYFIPCQTAWLMP